MGLPWLKPIRLAAFSLLPVALLLLTAEGVVRLARLDRPAYFAGGFGDVEDADAGGVVDVDLGWRGKPGYRQAGKDGRESYELNSLGLRSPEVAPRLPGELRILSLGESTTAGVLVAAEETYSVRLQGLLAQRLGPRPVTVVNAGVSGYSSFQSLKYLELKGLELRPDVVLFYHEINDYLPSTIRAPREGEVEILETDRQLYDSGLFRLSRWFLAHSALYRFLANVWADRRIDAIRRASSGTAYWEVKSPMEEIGLPRGMVNMGAFPYHVGAGGKKTRAIDINPALVGRRVSEAERLDNLRRLALVCRERGIVLVVIHPSYRLSARHQCLLTRFCAENGVPMVEAHDLLHPPGLPPGSLFLDDMHPSPAGHEALAEALARAIPGLLGERSAGI